MISVAHSLAIIFSANNVTDTIPGQDLWEYRYAVNQAFAAGEGFTIYFPSAQFTSFQSSSPSVSNFDLLVTQPDSGVNLPGFYDLATVPFPTPPTATFQVRFVYTGPVGTSPGSQSSDIGSGSGNNS